MANLCVWNSGLTELKRLKLELALKVNNGDVLDLGSGENPFAFSFAYADKVTEINFSDKNPDIIETLTNKISRLSPEYLNETENEILQHLDLDIAETLENILDKTNEILEFDFTKNKLEQQFDFITAFECIASVNSFDEFNNTMLNIADMLKQGGQLVGISTRYQEQTEHTLELIKSGNEGLLNPDIKEYETAFTNAGLSIITLDKKPVQNIKNYSEVVIFNVRK